MEIDKEQLQNKITEMSEKMGLKLVDIFASYHFQSEDLKFSGFGNIVSKVPIEFYKDNLAKFIENFQKSIEFALGQMYNNKFGVKILFWR